MEKRDHAVAFWTDQQTPIDDRKRAIEKARRDIEWCTAKLKDANIWLEHLYANYSREDYMLNLAKEAADKEKSKKDGK